VSSQEPLTPEEEVQLDNLLSNPLFFPQGFEDFISKLVRNDVTSQLPFSQILKSDALKGEMQLFGGTSPTYPEWGPWKPVGTVEIPGPCEAMVFFSGSSYNWSGDYGMLGIDVNGGGVDGNQLIWYRGLYRRVFGGRAVYVALPNKQNTIKLMCQKLGSGDVDFQDLAMAVFRVFLTSS
jgi:hypothetical protein